MFPNLLKNKKNNLLNWNSENDIVFAKTLGSDFEWLITSKSFINYFENTVGRKFYEKTLIDAINHFLEESSHNKVCFFILDSMIKLSNEKFIIVPNYNVFDPLLWKPKIK